MSSLTRTWLKAWPPSPPPSSLLSDFSGTTHSKVPILSPFLSLSLSATGPFYRTIVLSNPPPYLSFLPLSCHFLPFPASLFQLLNLVTPLHYVETINDSTIAFFWIFNVVTQQLPPSLISSLLDTVTTVQ